MPLSSRRMRAFLESANHTYCADYFQKMVRLRGLKNILDDACCEDRPLLIREILAKPDLLYLNEEALSKLAEEWITRSANTAPLTELLLKLLTRRPLRRNLADSLVQLGADVNGFPRARSLSIAEVDHITMWLAEQLNFDINARNDRGETALVSLCREGSFREEKNRLDVLLELEIDVNLPDYEGKTALMHAARNYGVVKKLLLEENADLASRDREGRTALFYTDGCLLATSFLYRMGADVNAVDASGKNIFEYWYESKCRSLFKTFFHGVRALPDDQLRLGLNRENQCSFLCEEFLTIENFVPEYVKNFLNFSEINANSSLLEARNEWGHFLYNRYRKDIAIVRRLECLCAAKLWITDVALLPDKVMENHVKEHLFTLRILRKLDGK